ncbi:thioredoxin [Intestinibacillus massiliensis]|nr:thioredoxin [Intestinibacillus massiliensis]
MAILHLTEAEFDNEVKSSTVPVLVDFWASWCGPCKMLAPVLEEIDQEVAGNAKVCKVNVDEQPALAARFGIMSIPTMIFFKGGEESGKMVGVRAKEDILGELQA